MGVHVRSILVDRRGDAKAMRRSASYSDVTLEVIDYFAQRVGQLLELGVHDIILDPGFGFSKTTAQNYELLAQLGSLVEAFTQPLLVGFSRKSMIYRPLGITPEEALSGTTFLHALALERGAKILRVHDVRPAVEAVQLYEELRPFLRSGGALHYQHLRPL